MVGSVGEGWGSNQLAGYPFHVTVDFINISRSCGGEVGSMATLKCRDARLHFVDRWRRRHHKGSEKNLHACTAQLLRTRAQIHSLDCADALQHFMILSWDNPLTPDTSPDQNTTRVGRAQGLGPDCQAFSCQAAPQSRDPRICPPPIRPRH